ncbi:MAG: hypothetical protein EB127_15910 [Alphaproteobacteria bacterium]|nr:hypothetical protein [Alphaproteobacteria bacterium]
MINSLIGSIMNMKCDVYVQQNSQTSSGNVSREWVYSKTIDCRVEPIKLGGSTNSGDNKTFDVGPENRYTEMFQLKVKSPVQLSRRSRISSIRDNQGRVIYKEIDRYGNPDMIFEVTASHAEIDPLGRVNYYETTIQRVEVQYNDSTSS